MAISSKTHATKSLNQSVLDSLGQTGLTGRSNRSDRLNRFQLFWAPHHFPDPLPLSLTGSLYLSHARSLFLSRPHTVPPLKPSNPHSPNPSPQIYSKAWGGCNQRGGSSSPRFPTQGAADPSSSRHSRYSS